MKTWTDPLRSLLPLKPSVEETSVAIDYGNGAVTETRAVAWSLTNLGDPAQEAIIVRPYDSLLLGWRDDGGEHPHGVYVEVFRVSSYATPIPETSGQTEYFSLLGDLQSDPQAFENFLLTGLESPYDAVESAIFKYADGSSREFSNASTRAYVPLDGTPVADAVLADAFGLAPAEVGTVRLGLPGEYVVRTSWRDADGLDFESFTAVSVPEIELGNPIAAIIGFTRDWIPPMLPLSATLSSDPEIALEELGSSDRRGFTLATRSTRIRRVMARTFEDGPVADTVDVNSIADYSEEFRGTLKVLDTFSDGTRLVEFTIALGGELPDDFEIRIEPYRAGVTFEDGTLQRVLTPDDLDELGRYRYRMLVPPDVPGSACHYYQFEQGGDIVKIRT